MTLDNARNRNMVFVIDYGDGSQQVVDQWAGESSPVNVNLCPCIY